MVSYETNSPGKHYVFSSLWSVIVLHVTFVRNPDFPIVSISILQTNHSNIVPNYCPRRLLIGHTFALTDLPFIPSENPFYIHYGRQDVHSNVLDSPSNRPSIRHNIPSNICYIFFYLSHLSILIAHPSY